MNNLNKYIINVKKVMEDKEKRIGIIFLITLFLLCIVGYCGSYYIEKNGIYTIGVIISVEHAPRGGYVGEFAYSYRGLTYKEKATFPETQVNASSIGKRLYVVFLPNRPQSCVALDDVPYYIGDAPPEGWTEIPKCE